MLYMKLFYNQKINFFYDYNPKFYKLDQNPIIWIYRLLNCLDQKMIGTSYRHTTQEFIKNIQDTNFPGIHFNEDLSINRHPTNGFWYIYYPDPIIESPAARDREGNFLLWDEDKIFDLLTPENSLKISQENLIELLETWQIFLSKKHRPPFILIWQDDQEWIRIENFDDEASMNQRVNAIEQIHKY